MKPLPLIVIPARMKSTRFPNKPIALIGGKTMIERVWSIAKSVKSADRVVIATDDEELSRFASRFGAEVVMTSPLCRTGTDRVAELSFKFNAHSLFFNLQGDAVLTPPWVIEEILQAILVDPEIQIATPAIRLEGKALSQFLEAKQRGSSTGTTVVFDQKQNALYFSKAVLPFHRNREKIEAPLFRHIGLYAYRIETLRQLSSLPEGPLEKAEKLEQLRALEHGIPIRVIEVDYRGRTHGSVDSPEDISLIESLIRNEGEMV